MPLVDRKPLDLSSVFKVCMYAAVCVHVNRVSVHVRHLSIREAFEHVRVYAFCICHIPVIWCHPLSPPPPHVQAVLAEGGCEEVTRCRKWRAVARKVSQQISNEGLGPQSCQRQILGRCVYVVCDVRNILCT